MKKYPKKLSSIILLLVSGAVLLFSAGDDGSAPAVTALQLPRPLHPLWGRELPGGSRLAYAAGSLYVSRRYGLSRLDLKSRKWSFLPLPRNAAAGPIFSFSVQGKGITVVTTDGIVLYRNAGGRWRTLRKIAAGSGLTVSRGKKSWLVSSGTAAPLFAGKPLYTLPFGNRVRSNSFLLAAGWAYLGTDSGLYRFSPSGKIWEALGARDHLTKASVQGGVPWRRGLVLVSSRAQYARIQANVRMTSYGTFVYNYLQQRWDRQKRRVSPAMRRFLRLNRRNTALPPGGIWLYYPPLPLMLSRETYNGYLIRIQRGGVVASLSPAAASGLLRSLYKKKGNEYRLSVYRSPERAWRLARVLEKLGYRERAVRYGWKGLDFFRIIRLAAGRYWTATRRGVFEFRIRDGRGEVLPVAEFRKRYIDDLVRIGGGVSVLSGGEIFLIPLPENGDRINYNEFNKREKKGSPLMRKGDMSEVGRFVEQMERYLKNR